MKRNRLETGHIDNDKLNFMAPYERIRENEIRQKEKKKIKNRKNRKNKGNRYEK